MVVSQRFELKKEDLIKAGTNALIFLGPALLMLIPAIAKQIPAEAGYGALALYILNLLTDLLKKFLVETIYK